MKDTNEEPTCWKNAMVGSFSFYELTEQQEQDDDGNLIYSPGSNPLSSDYISRMPEDNALSFKSDLSDQLAKIESQLDDSVVKILLMD